VVHLILDGRQLYFMKTILSHFVRKKHFTLHHFFSLEF